MHMNTDHPIPQQLLLATDLGQRCDRPLDRAKQLAGAWPARLNILMVRDGPGSPDEVASWLNRSTAVQAFTLAARAAVAAEFADTKVHATLDIVPGDVTDGIAGASRTGSFQELLPGSTAARLAQELAQPLLVVRQRVRGTSDELLRHLSCDTLLVRSAQASPDRDRT